MPPALNRAIEALFSASVSNGSWVFKIILPVMSGTVVASNFLEQRLVGCPLVRSVKGFLEPLAPYQALQSFNDSCSLLDFAERCGGFIELKTEENGRLEDVSILLSAADRELVARLNTPWVVADLVHVQRKRVALVRGRPDMNSGGPVYRAVASLGMDLVIIDEPGHWLSPDTAETRAIREAFLETDMTEDEGVVDRIVSSIEAFGRPVHGIFTLSDNFFVTVARVATRLGLTTNPTEAYQISTDKYRSRQLQLGPSTQAAVRVTSVAELKALIDDSDGASRPCQFVPSFPMIVKPTNGWGSECVAKVSTTEELSQAVDRACARHTTSRACVVEPFYAGPEVDANFVLLDGEILFSEIADEPPCDADAPGATAANTFSSVGLIMPSVLPRDEQMCIRTTVRDLLVKAGFRTGVFHCEARMTNSRAEYRCVDGNVDLAAATSSPVLAEPEPACKLLEINARPPAFRVTLPTLYTYGVNYFQLHTLAAVGDHVRLATLSRAFDFVSTTDSPHVHPHAQCWSQLIYIPSPGTGVVTSKQDACAELLERRPDLAQHIALAWDYFHPGDNVTEMTDGARTYVAYIHVWTREGGRRRVMELAEEVRREFCFLVE